MIGSTETYRRRAVEWLVGGQALATRCGACAQGAPQNPVFAVAGRNRLPFCEPGFTRLLAAGSTPKRGTKSGGNGPSSPSRGRRTR